MRWLPIILFVPVIQAADPAARWVDDALAMSDRVAVLVVADRYASNASWNLRDADRSLTAVKQALVTGADIPLRFQKEVRGEQVTLPAVRTAIESSAQRVTGSGILVVYWLGHGWIDTERQSVYFTHFTTEDGNGGFRDCIPRAELGRLTESARAGVRARGGDLSVVMLADACRIPVGAPPPQGRLAPTQDWEVFSTKAGAFTQFPQGTATPFSTGWSAALQAAARLAQPTDLRVVFEDAARRTTESTGGNQVPELVAPPGGEPPAIARQPRVRVRARAVDALAGSLVRKVSITVDRDKPRDLDGEPLLAVLPGKVTVTAQAVGYLPTTVTVDAPLERSGANLELPVYPQVAVIRGTFPGARQPVRVTGVAAELRADCHRIASETDGTGAFTLLIPEVTPGLVLEIGGRSLPLPEDPARWPSRRLVEGVSAPTIDIGMVTPKEAGVLAQRAPAVQPHAADPAPVVGVRPQAQTDTAPQAADRFIQMPVEDGRRWPDYSRCDARLVAVNDVYDLADMGTPAGLMPVRWLVAARTDRILDAAIAGTPRGSAPLTPVDGIRRDRRTVDLTMVGTPIGVVPLAAADVAERVGTVLDCSDIGTPAGAMPLDHAQVGERVETVIDLGDAGHPSSQPFVIPEGLRQAMEQAVR